MLDIDKVDLTAIAEALEDHSYERSWWFDPATGQVEPWSEDISALVDEEPPEDRGLTRIEPINSAEGYRDMEEFTARVGEGRPRDLLERAIQGRGAFRRFKDTLFDLPELRQSWFDFHDVRMQRRAIEWLAQRGVVEPRVAEEELRGRPDPELPGLIQVEPLDPIAVAESVATELRGIYGERLHRVLLFGSWARGDAHPESDIDLLVVLEETRSPWLELRRMEPVLWRHSQENDVVVTAVPVSRSDLEEGRWPLLRRVRDEGRQVA